jgi:hypothetical protein
MARRLVALFLCLGLVLGLAQSVQATIEPPVVTITLGPYGTPTTFTAPMTLGAYGWSLPSHNFSVENGLVSMTLELFTDITATDPRIDWSLTASSIGHPVGDFGFSVSIPIFLPSGMPTVVASSIEGTLYNPYRFGNFIAPRNASGFLQDTTLVSAASTWSAGLSAQIDDFSLNDVPYGPFAFGPEAGPLGVGPDFLSISVLGQAGEGDFSLTGFTSITTVPLPSAFILLGSGLLGLTGWSRFRKI